MIEQVDPPKNAGPELEKVIYGLLAKDPAQRLDDARARVLLMAVLDAPEVAPPVSPRSPGSYRCRRDPSRRRRGRSPTSAGRPTRPPTGCGAP